MKRRREGNELSLAFLDVICCGFGAIILLLMITKISLPTILEVSLEDIAAQMAERQKEIEKILGETTVLERTRVESEENLENQLLRLRELQEELLELTSRYETVQQNTVEQAEEEADLARAKQSLTDIMISLLGEDYRSKNDAIGGISVDSEYVIFVIDTSGSMQTYAWPSVIQKVSEVLEIYPVVKGIQVLNDMGKYMFPRTRGEWIDDTPMRRKTIMERLRTWAIHSNSSPVEGIEEAINTYYATDKRISIYVFGDDFQGHSVENVVDRVAMVNPKDAEGNCRVRIHGVGFPVYFNRGDAQGNVYWYGLLMRKLTVGNCGTYIALPSLI